jgi:hypothetical protein
MNLGEEWRTLTGISGIVDGEDRVKANFEASCDC